MRLLEPLRRVVDPVCLDAVRVPERGPALLVGNHTVYGLQDAPLMVAELHRRRGLFPRALGDHAHFVIPVWGDLLRAFGVSTARARTAAGCSQTGRSCSCSRAARAR